MARVLAFYEDVRRLPLTSIYHTNDSCSVAQTVERKKRALGTGGRERCPECIFLETGLPFGGARGITL